MSHPRPHGQDLHHMALINYHRTLHYLHHAVQYPSYRTSVDLIAAALIISAYEMLSGNLSDWQGHLRHVYSILQAQSVHGEPAGLRSAAEWAFLGQDIWAALRYRQKPLARWVSQRTLEGLSPPELATRVLQIATEVASYYADNERAVGFQDRMDRATELHGMLGA